MPRPHEDVGIRNGGVVRDGRAASSGREGHLEEKVSEAGTEVGTEARNVTRMSWWPQHRRLDKVPLTGPKTQGQCRNSLLPASRPPGLPRCWVSGSAGSEAHLPCSAPSVLCPAKGTASAAPKSPALRMPGQEKALCRAQLGVSMALGCPSAAGPASLWTPGPSLGPSWLCWSLQECSRMLPLPLSPPPPCPPSHPCPQPFPSAFCQKNPEQSSVLSWPCLPGRVVRRDSAFRFMK